MIKYWTTDNLYPSYVYSRSVIKHYAKSFSLAASLLPKEKKWATYSIYNFCRYVDNIVDIPRSRSDKEVMEELIDVEKELRIAYRTKESQHPVVSSFIRSALIYDIPIQYPIDMIRGVEMDLTIKRYDTFEELYLFCYRVAAVVGLMMSKVIGLHDDKFLINAEWLGIAMQLTNILRDIKEDAEQNRIYLPRQDLIRFGVDEKDILKGRFTRQLKELISFYAEKANQYYLDGNKGIEFLNKDSRYPITSASIIYSTILEKIKNRGYDPFLGRVYVSTASKFLIIFKEYIKSKA